MKSKLLLKRGLINVLHKKFRDWFAALDPDQQGKDNKESVSGITA
ncbi:hypothetical protein [Enterobacter sp.]|nr:hypothetical protein [Enterobacter sp.]